MNLRIISGSLKGKKIATIPGLSTRPTSDKVREAIFSIIGHGINAIEPFKVFFNELSGYLFADIDAIASGNFFTQMMRRFTYMKAIGSGTVDLPV